LQSLSTGSLCISWKGILSISACLFSQMIFRWNSLEGFYFCDRGRRLTWMTFCWRLFSFWRFIFAPGSWWRCRHWCPLSLHLGSGCLSLLEPFSSLISPLQVLIFHPGELGLQVLSEQMLVCSQLLFLAACCELVPDITVAVVFLLFSTAGLIKRFFGFGG